MKRILIFGLSPSCGGVEMQVLNFCRHFDEKRLCCDLLCYDERPYGAAQIEARGGRCILLPGRRKHPLANRRALDAFFAEHAGDYAAFWCNLCTLSDTGPLRAAKKHGVPCRVIHAHNAQNMGSALPGLLHALHKGSIGRLATDFFACSETAGAYFYPAAVRAGGRYRVIHNAVEAERFRFCARVRRETREALGLADAFVIGNVGRLHPQKNQAFLLEAFALLLRRVPEAVLLLVGEGALRETLEARADRADLRGHVRFAGARADVPALLQAMDVFAFPSLYEGLGIAAIEAQAAGLPCLLSEAIPEEAALTPLARRVGPEASDWADAMAAAQGAPRADTLAEIRAAGYAIREEAAALQNFFTEAGR